MSPGSPFGSRGHIGPTPCASCISRVLAMISGHCIAALLAAPLLEAMECPRQMRRTSSITFSEKALPPESAGVGLLCQLSRFGKLISTWILIKTYDANMGIPTKKPRLVRDFSKLGKACHITS